MKRLILPMLLCLSGLWAQAQTYAVNDTIIIRLPGQGTDTVYLFNNDFAIDGIDSNSVLLRGLFGGPSPTVASSYSSTVTYSATNGYAVLTVNGPAWNRTEFFGYSWTTRSGQQRNANIVILPMPYGCDFSVDSVATTPAICGGYEGRVELVGYNVAGNVTNFEGYHINTNDLLFSSSTHIATNARPGMFGGNFTTSIPACAGSLYFIDGFVDNLGLHQPISIGNITTYCSNAYVNLSANALPGITVTGPDSYWTYMGSTTDYIYNLPRNGAYFFNDANGCVVRAEMDSLFNSNSITITETPTGGGQVQLGVDVAVGVSVTGYYWYANAQYVNTPTALSYVGDVVVVTVVNSTGCFAFANITVTGGSNPCNLNVTSTIDTTGMPPGYCNVYLAVLGGTPPYTYRWSNGSTAPVGSFLATGFIYVVTVIDVTGCTVSSQIDTRQNCPPVNLTASYSSSCFNPTGDVTVTLGVSPGFQPVSYFWGNGATTPVTSVYPGTVTCVVTDANGCTGGQAFNVYDPNQVDSILVQTTPTCRNGATGTINVFAIANDTLWYSFGNQAPTTQRSFDGLSAGVYSLTVTTNSGGCSSTYPFTITETAATFNNVITGASCPQVNNGSVAFYPARHLSSRTTFTYNSQSVMAGIPFSGLPVGAYVFNYYDSLNLCQDTVSVVIPQDSFTLDARPLPACNGISNGGINLFPRLNISQGVFTYRWSNNSTTQNLAFVRPGVYSVTVSERNGCTATTTQQVGAITAWVGIAGSPYLCPSVPTVLRASSTGGPNFYTWTPGNITNQNLQAQGAGLHTVLMTTPNGCTASASINITATPTCLNLPPVTRRDTLNIGYVANTSRTIGGAFSQYLNNDFDPEGLPLRTNYTIVRNGVHGIANSFSGWLQYSMPTNYQPLDSIQYLVCEDVPGGLCTTSTLVLRMQDCDFRFQQTFLSSCGQDGAVTLTPTNGTGPFRYFNNGTSTISPANVILTNLAPGGQSVMIETDGGCVDSIYFTVPYRRSTNVQLLTSPPSCTRDFLTVTATGGTNVRWSDGLQSRIRRINTVRELMVYAQDGNCQFIDTVRYIPFLTTEIISTKNCSAGNESLTVTANSTNGGPYTFRWSNNSNSSMVVLTPGTYTYTVVDAGGCGRSFTHVSTLQSNHYVSITSVASDTCGLGTGVLRAEVLPSGWNNGNIQHSTPQNVQFVWSNAFQTPSISGLLAGGYSVTATDSLGCAFVGFAFVYTYSSFVARANTTPTSCQQPSGEASIRFYGNPVTPIRYTWDDGSFGTTAQNLSAGFHRVTIVDATGCPSILSYNIETNAHFSVETTQSNTLCGRPNTGSATAFLRGIPQGAVTYRWSHNNSTSQTVNGLGLGSYVVSVSDASGCMQIAVVNINESVPFDLRIEKTNAACQTISGSASAIVTGNPNGAVTYRWDGGSPTSLTVVNGLNVGRHVVTATDQAGCSQALDYEISSAQSFVLYSSGNIVHSLCGAPNGSIIPNQPFVYIPYRSISYTWSNGQSTPNVSGLVPNVYTVTATDGACTAEASFVVNDRDWLNPFVAVTYVNCTSPNSGSATVTLPASLAGLSQSFVWSNYATAPSISGLPAGWYSLVAMVGNTCEGHANFEIVRDPGCMVSIYGQVVDDEQGRTCTLNGQVGIRGKQIRCTGPNGYIAHDYTDEAGLYHFDAPEPGAYTIDLLNSWTPFELPWQPICGSTISTTIANYGDFSANNNFYMELVDSVRNLVTVATSFGTARPGIDRPYRISTVNLGGSAATGQTAFTWDQNLDNYVNLSSVPNAALNLLNRTVNYDFAQLPSGSGRDFDFNLTIPVNVQMGTLLSSTAVSLPLAGDDYPLNNYYLYTQEVTNSYDPNDKHANLGRVLTRNDSTLIYTIRFQNTGTDTAYTVVIRDTLDANVYDVLTATPIKASHAYKLKFKEPNVLEFRFENIMLVDSFRNEPGSHGYVTFAIRLKKDLPYGTFVKNKAAIFFDFNDPIITNTAINELVAPVARYVDDPFMSLYPNPTSGTTTMRFELAYPSDNIKVSVFDALGREYWYTQTNAVPGANFLEIPELPNGIWFVRYANGGVVFTKPLISQK